jgi:hypothetical protein
MGHQMTFRAIEVGLGHLLAIIRRFHIYRTQRRNHKILQLPAMMRDEAAADNPISAFAFAFATISSGPSFPFWSFFFFLVCSPLSQDLRPSVPSRGDPF